MEKVLALRNDLGPFGETPCLGGPLLKLFLHNPPLSILPLKGGSPSFFLVTLDRLLLPHHVPTSKFPLT